MIMKQTVIPRKTSSAVNREAGGISSRLVSEYKNYITEKLR